MKRLVVLLMLISLCSIVVQGQDEQVNGQLTVTTTSGNTLRLLNDAPGKEALLRMRAKPSNNTGWFHADIGAYSTSTTSETGFLGFKVPYDNTVGQGYDMVVNSSGNVGIGTINPVGDGLTVVGGDTGQDILTLERPGIGKIRINAGGYHTRMTINSKNLDRFSIGYDDTKEGLGLTNDINFTSHAHPIFIHNNGRVGIGTSDLTIGGTSVNTLVVGDASSSEGIVVNANGNNDGIYAFAENGTLSTRFLYNHPTGRLKYEKYGGSALLTITDSGLVGIGNDSPGAALELNATATAWAEGVVINPATNGFGEVFFRKTDGSSLETWSMGKMNSDDFAILRQGLVTMTGTSRTDAVFTIDHLTGNAVFGSSVGIGAAPCEDCRLAVDGKIKSEEVLVDVIPGSGPDFVFEAGYDLKSLEETESYIQQNKHLPEIPSAKQMEEEGLELREMNLKLLQKVEELTLHLIDQNKQMKDLKQEVADLKNELRDIRN